MSGLLDDAITWLAVECSSSSSCFDRNANGTLKLHSVFENGIQKCNPSREIAGRRIFSFLFCTMYIYIVLRYSTKAPITASSVKKTKGNY